MIRAPSVEIEREDDRADQRACEQEDDERRTHDCGTAVPGAKAAFHLLAVVLAALAVAVSVAARVGTARVRIVSARRGVAAHTSQAVKALTLIAFAPIAIRPTAAIAQAAGADLAAGLDGHRLCAKEEHAAGRSIPRMGRESPAGLHDHCSKVRDALYHHLIRQSLKTM